MGNDILKRLSALEDEVGYLRDRLKILDCISRYSRGIDRMDLDLVRSVYHEDAIDEHGVMVTSREEFVAFIDSIRDDFEMRLHNITTHNCEIHGMEAHAESYVLFGLATNDGRELMLGGGRYVDRLEKRKENWKIVHRRTMMDWMAKADKSPFNSAQAKAWGYPKGRKDRRDDSYQRPLKLDRLPRNGTSRQ